MKYLAILQARVSSSRLPGKVLKSILDKPMLVRQLERLTFCKKIDKLIIATSEDPSDDAIFSLCKELNVTCYRGSLNDVLDRFYQVAKTYHPEHVIRLTGDCPLIDPFIVDAVVKNHINKKNDYTSNSLEPTFPDGLDVEIFKFACLEKAWNEATLPSEREHVTSYIHKQPQAFKIGHFKRELDISHHRWTVDEPEDFELVTRIYEILYPSNNIFSTEEILALLEQQPDLLALNIDIKRNEGTKKSLKEDANFLNNQMA